MSYFVPCSMSPSKPLLPELMRIFKPSCCTQSYCYFNLSVFHGNQNQQSYVQEKELITLGKLGKI